jgi:hypothetical protein
VQQLGSQESSTTQQATSEAKSTQLAPTNFNAPVSLLGIGFGTGHHAKGGHGKDGGSDVKQSNHSQAVSSAKNTARTVQVMDQDQQVHARPEPVRPGHHGEKPHRHDRGCEHGKWWKHQPKHGHGHGHGPKPQHGNHSPKAGAVQSGEQKSHTEQDADSEAKSTQVLPVNVNAPIQVLSVGSNGGDVEQSNSSKAESEAKNSSTTKQYLDQSQQVRGGSDHRWKHGPSQGGAVQSGEQEATTDQSASSEAKSTQVLPVNVNAPIQVLSVGSNGGDVEQSNRSAAESEASNHATTQQGLQQDQRVTGGSGPGGAVQSGEQEAATEQDADSSATSTQVLPVNVNVPLQVLSLGSNGGDVSQSNSSSAQSEASNSANTVQGLAQSQLLG